MKKNKLEKLNQRFYSFSQLIVKFRWYFIIAFILLNIFAITGLNRLQLDSSTDGWFLEGDEMKKATDRFKDVFGNNDFVAILFEADDVFLPENLKMLRELGHELEDNVPFADKVISLTDMEFSRAKDDEIIIEDLVPYPVPVEMKEIEKIRELALSKTGFVNKIVSDDSTQTWLMLRLYPFPDDWQAKGEEEPNSRVGNAVLKVLNQGFPDKAEVKVFKNILSQINDPYDRHFVMTQYEKNTEDGTYNLKTMKEGHGFLGKIIINGKIKEQMKKLEKIAESIGYKYKKYDLKAAGMPVMTTEEMHYFEEDGGRVIMLAFLLSLVLLVLMLRSLRGVIVPLITMISSIIIVYGFMGWMGIKVNTVLMTVPVFLGMAVSIGYSIHIFNFFKRRYIDTGERKNSIHFAIKETGWSLFFTALTTICSLLSFLFISLYPLRWLGLTTAATIFTIYVIIMVLTPALLSFGKDKKAKSQKPSHRLIRSDRNFSLFGRSVHRFGLLILIGFALFTGIFIYGVTQLEINVNIESSYGLKIPYVKRMHDVGHSRLGSIGSYDVTLKFTEPDMIKEPDVLKRFEKFEEIIKGLKVTKRTSSILDIIKDMNKLFNEDQQEFYKLPEDKLLIAQLLLLYDISGGTESTEWVDTNYQTLRLMVEVDDFDAKEIVKEIEVIREAAAQIFPDAVYDISGTMPQFVTLNQYVAAGQIKSFLVALAAIMVLMMIVFRSIKTGLIGLIPNITPALVVAGLLGFSKTPLDFYTVTIIPMILGLAVDDTIHFINHARMEFYRTGSYIKSNLITFQTVGRSLFMTSFILVASFSLYLTSEAKMFFNLGIFIVVGISSALITDYLITPLLLNWTKPFGKEKTGVLNDIEKSWKVFDQEQN